MLFLSTLASVFNLTRYLLVVGFCFYVWRYSRLKTIPWLLGYWIVQGIAAFPIPQLIERVIDRGLPPTYEYTMGRMLQSVEYVTSLFGTVGLIIATILVFSEFSFVLAHSSLGQGIAIPRFIKGARNHVKFLGSVMIGFEVVTPAPWICLLILGV